MALAALDAAAWSAERQKDHPDLVDDLQLKAHFAEQKLSEATSAISNAAVDAAASAGLPRAEHLQQQRSQRRATKAQRKAREQMIYKISAIVASAGVCTAAIGAVYIRFAWNMGDLGEREFPVAQAIATLLLTFGGVVGMEMWARWAHRALWHDFQPGWALHKSHHEPRVGPFEDNDIFAIINAVPAIALCLYGFITPTLFGGICFGAGLGITLFGIMYMFIHDGMVHKRFPVGPIAEVPYLQRVAAAHKLHHAERHHGVPWGMFLGPQELEAVGGKEDLDKLCKSMFPRK